jgi:hypothetical protein
MYVARYRTYFGQQSISKIIAVYVTVAIRQKSFKLYIITGG